jgi:hypothetical protein
VKGQIKCDRCGYLLGHVGDEVFLLRSVAIVYDMKLGCFLSRCGNCKKFSRIESKMPDF